MCVRGGVGLLACLLLAALMLACLLLACCLLACLLLACCSPADARKRLAKHTNKILMPRNRRLQ